MRRAALLALFAVNAVPAAAGQRIAAHFIDDRVLVDAPLTGGRRLRLFTDTGGGSTIVSPEAARRLLLATEPVTGPAASEVPPGSRRLRGALPLARSSFPPPPQPQFVATDQLTTLLHAAPNSEGTLGNNWFAGHVWTWDYPAGTLVIEPSAWQPTKADRVVPVSFRPAQDGVAALHFPRIMIDIAGEQIPMLLDTGASTVLTPAAVAAVGGPALRATSMIVASKIAAWRHAHPAWRVIEHAQRGTGARMIQVPDVRIAGIEVGPIWFTERADANFREVMSGAMDAPVEGAIGGNAFHSLRMTIDYLHGRASFRRSGTGTR